MRIEGKDGLDIILLDVFADKLANGVLTPLLFQAIFQFRMRNTLVSMKS